MRESFKLALIKNTSWGFGKKTEWLKTTLSYIEEMGRKGVDLLVFPGAFVPNYAERYDIYKKAEDIPGDMTERLSKAAKEAGTYVILGIVEKGKRLSEIYNTSIVISPQRGLLAAYRAIHLSELEKSIFKTGNKLGLIETDYSKTGLIVGYDVFFPELIRTLALKGAEMIVAISCFSPMGVGALGSFKGQRIARVLRVISVVDALENHLYYIHCSGEGCFMKKNCDGPYHSQIINPLGEVIGRSASFKRGIMWANIRAEILEVSKKYYSFFKDRHPKKYFSIAWPCDYKFPGTVGNERKS